MAYTKTQWENRNPNTPLNDANLNKIEQGIYDAHILAEQAGTDATSALTSISLVQADISQLQNDSTSQLTSITQLQTDSTSLKQYFTWRTIATDTTTDIVLNNVDNVFFSVPNVGADGTISCILPPTPSADAQIRIVDAGQGFATNVVRIKRNGKLIMGVADDLYLNVDNQNITLVWSGDTFGWVIINKT